MRFKMANIKDVASYANVSIATVSYYLNKTKNVSEKTQIAIEEAIKALGYQPDFVAKSLKTNTNKDIFYICPDLSNTFYQKVFLGLESILAPLDYNIVISLTDELPALESECIQKAIGKRAAGIILVTCQPENEEIFEKLNDNKIPVVYIERLPTKGYFNTVTIDNNATINKITKKLLEQGIKDIGLFTGPKVYSCEKACIGGFLNAFNDYELEPGYIFEGHYNREDAFKTVMSLLLSKNIPSAYIATSIPISEGIMEAISIYKIGNKYDPIVISLAEDTWLKYYNNTNVIKTMRPAELLGEKAADLIIKNIKSPIIFEPRDVVLNDLFKTSTGLNFNKTIEKKNSKKGKFEEINVLMMDNPASYNSIAALLSLFNAEENIRVNIETRTQVQLYNEIVSESEKRSSKYDVFMVDVPWVPFLANMDYLYNLTDLLKEENKLMNSFIPGVPESFCQHNGSLYALPFTYATQVLFYRSDIFADKIIKNEFERKYKIPLAIPRNWLEFNVVSKFFTEEFNENSPTKYGTSLAASFPESLIAEFSPRQWSYGGNFFSEDGRAIFNTTENAKALANYIESFIYSTPQSKNNNITEQVEDFYNGETAMLVTYLMYASDIGDRFKSKVIGKVGYSVIPGQSPVLAGWNMAINNYSKKINTSYKFIKWACSPEISVPYTIIGGNSPHLSPYKNNHLKNMYPWMNVALESFKYCRKRFTPYIPGKSIIPTKVWEEAVYNTIYRAILKEISVEEALFEGQIVLTNVLKKYGYV
jgi:multiple sugar transport system substrate-binding protein